MENSKLSSENNRVTVKFDVFPFGHGDSSSSTSTSHEVLVDGLESSQIICLLCTKVVTAPSTGSSLRQMKETITEIAIIDSAYLHSTEDHLGFCDSCQQKIEQLGDFYSKFVQWRDELVTLSTEISYLVLQTNTRFLWGESAENLIDESFYHEWNLHRIQQMLQSKLQVVKLSEHRSQLCTNPPTNDDGEGQDDIGVETNSVPFELVHVSSFMDDDGDCRSTIQVISGGAEGENVVEPAAKPPSPQQHQTNDGEPSYRCESCNKVFTRGYSLRLHMHSHTGDQSFACERCSKKFTSRKTLKAHQKVHMEKKKMTCPICGKSIGQKRAFDAHLHRHHVKDYRVSNVTCDVCRRSFPSPLQLMTHMNVHRGEFQCSTMGCRKAFNTCHFLEEHEKIHQSNVRLYDCDYCSSIFEDENSLNKHLPIHTTVTSFLCDHCGKCFPSKSLLHAHLRIHKNIEYKCKTCDKNFCSASNLKSHQRLHTGERPFQCQNCSLSFAQKASLNLHMRKHSGVNPFLCSYCETTGFTYKLAFRQHLATKHPEVYLESKKFLCKVCWKNFNAEDDLKEHEVTHEKHKCKLCNRQFKMLIHLKEHLLRHASLKPHKCSFCENKAFLRRKHLIDHIKKTHPEEDAEAAADVENMTYINEYLSPTKENKLVLRPAESVKKGGRDPELTRLLTKIQVNNEQQWKHVREFVRNILTVELQQEKWTRKSAEELNERLTKQNNHLRSKLQEKRNERLKLNEELQRIKNKYRSQSKAISQSQQFVATRCQETFEKLTKLYTELESIQKQMTKDMEKAPATSSSNGESSTSSPREQVSKVKIKIRKRVPTSSPELMTTNYEALTYPHLIPREDETDHLDEAVRLKVLSEYYPLMLESRSVIEHLLRRIGQRISHLIELANYHENLERSQNHNNPRVKSSKTHIEKRDDQSQDDNLLVLFSSDYDKLMKIQRQ